MLNIQNPGCQGFSNYIRDAARIGGHSLIELNGAVVLNSGSKADSYNYIWCLDSTKPHFNSDLEQSVDAFINQGLPFIMGCGQTDGPTFQNPDLQERGVVGASSISLLCRDLKNLPPVPTSTKFDIRGGCDDAFLTDFCKVIETVFEIPVEPSLKYFTPLAQHPETPFKFYIGYVDGKPVGTSILHCGTQTAALIYGGVLEEHRNMGIASAIAIQQMHDAKAAGTPLITVQCTDFSVQGAKRLGFKEDSDPVAFYSYTSK